jgi:hypothetical protein
MAMLNSVFARRLLLPALCVLPLQAGDLEPLSLKQLCVTKGSINAGPENNLEVIVPEMRAVAVEPTEQRVEARFTYLGRSQGEKRLGSGELRRQFGLKLRAANSCNLVYAMWRIKPKAGLVISVKSNPGQNTHAQCGTRGYTNIKPEHASPIPILKIGDKHTLRAEMQKRKLQVWIDEKLVWEGKVSEAAMKFDGPVGVRTDNGHFKFELLAPGRKSGQPIACKASNEDE